MSSNLAQSYRAQRNDELDRAEQARAALHAASWDALDLAAPFGDAIACAAPHHTAYAPDMALDVYAADHGEPSYIAVASDGSQVEPSSRHRYPMAMVQVATVRTYHDASGRRPHTVINEWDQNDPSIVEILLANERTAWKQKRLAELRDRHEIEQLAAGALAMIVPPSVAGIALVDGPLHIYEDHHVAERSVHYQAIRATGAYLAGIVDSGKASYLGKMLTAAGGEDFSEVRDTDIFGTLADGERSALFGIASSSNRTLRQRAGMVVGFFYLNVGGNVLRVETPTDLTYAEVNELARILISESAGMQYPYVLLQAHEAAVVTAGRRRRLEMLHKADLRKWALDEDLMSYKEQLKAR